MRTRNRWAKINKCVVCGTKLKFVASTSRDARPQEGVKICQQNHDRFLVYGTYDNNDEWNLTFVLPS